MTVGTSTEGTRTGRALAALVAAGVGCASLGFFTVLAEVSAGVRSLLNFYNPVGPLSGKTSVAALVWIVAWFVLARIWRGRMPLWRFALTAAYVLIALGFLGTFPPFFELFTPHP
jgi:hypothetical protein